MTLEADRREAKCELRATEQRHQEGPSMVWDSVAMASSIAGGCALTVTFQLVDLETPSPPHMAMKVIGVCVGVRYQRFEAC